MQTAINFIAKCIESINFIPGVLSTLSTLSNNRSSLFSSTKQTVKTDERAHLASNIAPTTPVAKNQANNGTLLESLIKGLSFGE